MADNPQVTPGNQTSEYKLAKVANVACYVLIAVGGALEAIPDANRPAWVGVALVVVGAATKFFTNMGYFKSRSQVKTAAMVAAGAANAVVKASESQSP